MPFFQNHMNKIHKKNKNVTLQVRIPQRALPFASPGLRASLTAEAAFVLPLFIFTVVCLMMPMRMLNQQRKIQAALESVCADASQYAYIKYQADSGKEQVKKQGERIREGAELEGGGWQQGAVLLWAAGAVRQKADGRAIEQVSFRESEILEDGETLDIVMSYKMKLPFPLLGISGIPMEARSRRRAWIGREGISGAGDSNGEEPEEEFVFVGKGSTRYHRRRTCHYLYNNISSAPYENIGERRNESGGRYHACSRCGKKAGAGTTVYIMPEGGSYHSDKGCSAITAYVKEVPLSQVEYLGPCSYCSN